MTKDVAVIGASGQVVAINVHSADYAIAENEIEVTNPAFVGGDYVDGFFYPPQPFASWSRHEGNWIPPVAMPTDGGLYLWNEEDQKWVSIDE